MTEGASREDFARWVQPHLTVMTRYAGRQVAPADRDDLVQEALIRAWQRWSTYDPARGSAAGWLLAIVADRCRRHRSRRPSGREVELVEHAAPPAQRHDIDLERAIAGLARRQRQAVDLHYLGPGRGDGGRGDGLRTRHGQGDPAPGASPVARAVGRRR